MPFDTERVQALFWRLVLESDPATRSRILDRECPDCEELRRRLEALLKAHEDTGGLLGAPLVGPLTGELWADLIAAATDARSQGQGEGPGPSP